MYALRTKKGTSMIPVPRGDASNNTEGSWRKVQKVEGKRGRDGLSPTTGSGKGEVGDNRFS